MVQIGVYGLGGISRRVIQGVLFSRNANLYAVCSSSIEKADAYKEEYGAKKAYDNYENMLQDTNIDMIYICTPNYLHAKHIQHEFKELMGNCKRHFIVWVTVAVCILL